MLPLLYILYNWISNFLLLLSIRSTSVCCLVSTPVARSCSSQLNLCCEVIDLLIQSHVLSCLWRVLTRAHLINTYNLNRFSYTRSCAHGFITIITEIRVRSHTTQHRAERNCNDYEMQTMVFSSHFISICIFIWFTTGNLEYMFTEV